MLVPFTSFRPVDWTSALQAAHSYAEQIRAYSRLPAERILPAPWWLLIDQTGAERLWRRPPEGAVTHCHFVDLIELDPYGMTAVINHEIGNIPEATYVAICPWDIVPQAVGHLRVHYLAGAFHPCSALTTHVREACFRLDIAERSANDARLPNCSRIRCGSLFRLDPSSAKTFCRYFCFPSPANLAEPTIAELGADCSVVYAGVNDSQEPFQAIITDSLFLPPAQKEISRWIRSHSRKRKEVLSTEVDDK